MEAKFTKGPWHRNIRPARKYPTVFAGRNTHVARIESLGLTDEEVEANCDLVKSAPLLFQTLVEELDAIRVWLSAETDADITDGMFISLDKIKRAISAVTGEKFIYLEPDTVSESEEV